MHESFLVDVISWGVLFILRRSGLLRLCNRHVHFRCYAGRILGVAVHEETAVCMLYEYRSPLLAW